MQLVGSDPMQSGNIQAPWSQFILEGRKTVETRGYPLPPKYQGVALAIIETPGPERLIDHARIVGVVVFSGSIQYQSKAHWEADYKRHLVEKTNVQFGFQRTKPKFGWVIDRVEAFERPFSAPKKKGIRFTSDCPIPSDSLKFQTYPSPLK